MGLQPAIEKKPKFAVSVRLFHPDDKAAFRRLNEQWITRYFTFEEKDVATLADPQSSIIDKGGQIFIAITNETAVGCCALVEMADGFTCELIKMAVDEQFQGLGIGRVLVNSAISWARENGVQRLWLETNHVLKSAIQLYESSGFTQVSKGKQIVSSYQRSDVQMEMWLH